MLYNLCQNLFVYLFRNQNGKHLARAIPDGALLPPPLVNERKVLFIHMFVCTSTCNRYLYQCEDKRTPSKLTCTRNLQCGARNRLQWSIPNT